MAGLIHDTAAPMVDSYGPEFVRRSAEQQKPPRRVTRRFIGLAMEQDGSVIGWSTSGESMTKREMRDVLDAARSTGSAFRPYCIQIELPSGRTRIRPAPGWRDPVFIEALELPADPLRWTVYLIGTDPSDPQHPRFAFDCEEPREAWTWARKWSRNPKGYSAVMVAPGRAVRFDRLPLWPRNWTAWQDVEGKLDVISGAGKPEDMGWFRETCQDAVREGDRLIVVSPFSDR